MNIFKQKKYTLLSGALKYGFFVIMLCILVAPMFAHAVFVSGCDPSTDPTCNTNTPLTNSASAPSLSNGGASNVPSSTSTPSNGGASNIPISNTSTPVAGVSVNTKIANPLGSNITDLPTFINVIVQFVLVIGIPIIVLAVIYAGFLFVTAQGNSEKLKSAKNTLLYTLIGAALLLGSFVIAKAIQGTVSQITS